MDWKQRLRKAAESAAQRVTEGAERAARYVADHGPAGIGDSAAEMLAERDYRRARAVAESGLQGATARQVLELLLPHWRVEGNLRPLINRLIGRAYEARDELGPAAEHLEYALADLHDFAVMRTAERVMVEQEGLLPRDVEWDLLITLAEVKLKDGRYDDCLRHARDAVDLDPRRPLAFYWQAAALAKMGRPIEDIGEVLLRACRCANPDVVLQWSRELMPDHGEWFRRMFG